MKKYIVTVIIIFCVLFINISGVNGAIVSEPGWTSSASCDYGIICNYEFCGKRGSTSDPGYISPECSDSEQHTILLSVAYTCDSTDISASNCDSFVSWAKVTRNYQLGSDVKFGNYDDIFKDADYWKDRFSHGFSCPSMYVSLKEPSANIFETEINNTYYFSYSDTSGKFIHPVTQENQQYTPEACIDKGTSFSDIDNKMGKIVEDNITDTDDPNASIFSGVDCSKEENKDTIICSIYAWGMDLTGGPKYSSDAVDPCALIDGDIQELLHKIFFGISVGGIIILVVMTAISLAKVITASEDEALKNFFKGLWKRLICLIILLLLPMIVTFIIQLVNNVAPSLGIKSDNPLCNVTE